MRLSHNMLILNWRALIAMEALIVQLFALRLILVMAFLMYAIV